MDWLCDLRRKTGITQEGLADAISIKRASYGNIENGKRRPSVSVAKRIAGVLGFDWTRFFDADEQKKTAPPGSGEA